MSDTKPGERAEGAERPLPRAAFLTEPDEIPHAYQMVPARIPHVFERFLPQIERMAAQGLEVTQIAARLQLPPQALIDAAVRFSDVAAAFTGGTARGADEMSASVYAAGLAGNVAAASLLLKAKYGYTQTVTIADTRDNRTDAAPVSVSRVAEIAALQSDLLGDE